MDKFQFWKYFSNKFILPLLAMLIWAWLLYMGKITGTTEMAVAAAILLMFSGLFSAHDAFTAWLKVKYPAKKGIV